MMLIKYILSCLLLTAGAFKPHHLNTSFKRVRNVLSLSSGKIQQPKNEFSRTFQADEILGVHRERNYSLRISAKPDELEALALRFKLPSIEKLEADLVFKNDSNTLSKGTNKGECIQAQGTVSAILTQKCVRTNELFSANLDFDLFSIIRSVGSRENKGDTAELSRFTDTKTKKKGKKRQKKGLTSDVRDFDEFAVRELQIAMGDFDFEDDVIEDTSVFRDGVVDAGELIAQLFRIKLDPYPKKPGSEPINLTFSG